jgi:hypothetical protein
MEAVIRLRRERLAWRMFGEEGLLLDLEHNRVHRFNSTGALVVEALFNEKSVESIIDSIVDTFDVEPAQARLDVEGLVSALAKEGVAEVLSSGRQSEIPPRPNRVTRKAGER